MMPLLAFVLSFAGFAWLALAMERHHYQVWREDPSGRARLALRLLGTAGLGLSLAACVAHEGWSVGFVLWFGMLTVAAVLVALLFTYRPRVFAASWPRMGRGAAGK